MEKRMREGRKKQEKDIRKIHFSMMIILLAMIVFAPGLSGAVTPQIAAGNGHTIGLKSNGTVVATGLMIDGYINPCEVSGWYDPAIDLKTQQIIQVDGGDFHSVGLRADGTVVATTIPEQCPYNFGQCDVYGDDWVDIVQIAAGGEHTLGLKANGEVVAVGLNDACDVMFCGFYQSLGRGQCDEVRNWYTYSGDPGDPRRIIQIDGGTFHSVGLRANGEVVAAPRFEGCDNTIKCTDPIYSEPLDASRCLAQCNIENWYTASDPPDPNDPRRFIQIVAADMSTAGLRADGTVEFAHYGGWDLFHLEDDRDHWQNYPGTGTDYQIKHIEMNYGLLVGIRKNGQVVTAGKYYANLAPTATPDLSGWYDPAVDPEGKQIVQVAAGVEYVVGLRYDGSFVVDGWNGYNQCNITGDQWTGFKYVDRGEHKQAIAAGLMHTAALTETATVKTVGNTMGHAAFDHGGLVYYGAGHVFDWADIQEIDCGLVHTAGVDGTGTAMSEGPGFYDIWGHHIIDTFYFGQSDGVGDWYTGSDFEDPQRIIQISAGDFHTVGLRANGEVVATGANDPEQTLCDSPPLPGFEFTSLLPGFDNYLANLTSASTSCEMIANNYRVGYGQCDVAGWYTYSPDDPDNPQRIVQVSAGGYHTVGLRANGEIVTAGYDAYHQCTGVGTSGETWNLFVYGNVEPQISAGGFHTVGLKSDGTVVAVGLGDGVPGSQCDVAGWYIPTSDPGDPRRIVQVSAGGLHTVGLRADGSAIATGNNDHGQCNVEEWADIVQVVAGPFHTVGLKADGTLVAVGLNIAGQCDVQNQVWNLNDICSAAPAPPVLTAPVGILDQPLPVYTWISAQCADNYMLCIQNKKQEDIFTMSYTAAQVDKGDGTCAINPDISLRPGNYYWLVKAINVYGESAWSAPKAFTVNKVKVRPEAPTLNTPSGTITETSPEYNWNAVSNASDYRLCIQNQKQKDILTMSYTAAQVDKGDGTCAINPSKTLMPGSYYWLVEAINEYGKSAWSASMAFTVVE